MKRRIKYLGVLLFIALILSVFVLTSCSGQTNPPKKVTEEEGKPNQDDDDPSLSLVYDEKQLNYYIINPNKWKSYAEEEGFDTTKWKNPGDSTHAAIDLSWYASGKKWKSKTFDISNEEELRGLAWLVNNRIDDFLGKTVNLIEDIKLKTYWIPIGQGSPRCGNTNYELNKNLGFGGLAKDISETWTQDFSKVYRFSGIFDGNNKTITCLSNLLSSVAETIDNADGNVPKLPRNSEYVGYMGEELLEALKIKNIQDLTSESTMHLSYGLFGLVEGTVDGSGNFVGGVIRNLKMDEVSIVINGNLFNATSNKGIPVPEGYTEKFSKMDIIYLGSVVGTAVNSVCLENIEVGGSSPKNIVHRSYGVEGESVSSETPGGIIGYYFTQEENLSSSNKYLFKMSSCKNKGVFPFSINAGGLVGTILGNQYNEVFLENCVNETRIGKINNTYPLQSCQRIGGIVCDITAARLDIRNCTNTGLLLLSSKGGGILGNANINSAISGATSVIKDCTNEGEIIGHNGYPQGVGGIIGSIDLKSSSSLLCDNLRSNGDIYGGYKGKMGGFIGNISNCPNATFSNLYLGSPTDRVNFTYAKIDYKPNYNTLNFFGGVFAESVSCLNITLDNVNLYFDNIDFGLQQSSNNLCWSGLVASTFDNTTDHVTTYNIKGLNVDMNGAVSIFQNNLKIIGNEKGLSEDQITSRVKLNFDSERPSQLVWRFVTAGYEAGTEQVSSTDSSFDSYLYAAKK